MNIYHQNKYGKELLIKTQDQEVKIILKDDTTSEFSLSLDEARAIRDRLSMSIKQQDEKSIQEPPVKKELSEASSGFGSFFNNEPEPEDQEYKLFNKKKEKTSTELYY